MARLAEFRHEREVEKAIDKDSFPTAAEAGLVSVQAPGQSS